MVVKDQKNNYYTLIQNVRDKNDWESFILFILEAVENTSQATLEIIKSIRALMEKTIAFCRKELPKTSYSKELIELLFVQPYTKIEFLVENGIAERRTSSKYLKQLEEIGVLESFKAWKQTIYINKELYNLLRHFR